MYYYDICFLFKSFRQEVDDLWGKAYDFDMFFSVDMGDHPIFKAYLEIPEDGPFFEMVEKEPERVLSRLYWFLKETKPFEMFPDAVEEIYEEAEDIRTRFLNLLTDFYHFERPAVPMPLPAIPLPLTKTHATIVIDY